MREWALSCVLAYGLDLWLGDPAWLPHPVAGIGQLVTWIEEGLYCAESRWAGVALLLLTAGATMTAVELVLLAAGWAGRWAHLAASVVLLWMAFATRSLLEHGGDVARALEAGEVPEARRRLARMVSRETAGLDEAEIARGCIESLAENLTDGCLSPFLFGLIGGPVAAWGLKAVSTLDSMVGYRSPRYLKFGWASARSDDGLHYFPARLLWLLLPLASMLTGASTGGCWRALRRDGRKSPSPNSGLPEAGVAGALGIALGGTNVYDGAAVMTERLNDAGRAPEVGDIRRTQRLVLAASGLPVVAVVGALVIVGIRGI